MINWNPIPDFTYPSVQVHFLTGGITSALTIMITPSLLPILLAVTVVASVKELWAYFHPDKYNVSLADAVATGLGGLLATTVMKLV